MTGAPGNYVTNNHGRKTKRRLRFGVCVCVCVCHYPGQYYESRTLFLVYTAAQLCVGPAVIWRIVARIGKAPMEGASNGIKVPDAVPVAKPCGKAATLFMYVK